MGDIHPALLEPWNTCAGFETLIQTEDRTL